MSTTDENSELEAVSRPRKRRKVRQKDNEACTLPTRPFKASRKVLSYEDYAVGWICALPLEVTAAKAMLDDIHTDLESRTNDDNAYIFGRIGHHSVVIAGLPSGVYGTTSATSVAHQMDASFPSLRIRLMVGIGGGVPGGDTDIRLGDVVVSTPNSKCAAVVQYDYGKTVKDGRLERMGFLNKPPQLLLRAITKIQANHDLSGNHIPKLLSDVKSRWPTVADKYAYRGNAEDLLFLADYEHQDRKDTCHICDRGKLVNRLPRDTKPKIHYGPIASANQVMKHAATRDRLANELGIICFEMEAAGLMDNFPCLVIRGISDYSDSHNHYPWQNYAAATAAAYSKELLLAIPPTATASMAGEGEDGHVLSESIAEHRRSLVESLKFDQADTRRANIKPAHAKTCVWLFQLPEYRHWTDWAKIVEHHGLLWIKGKPGTGKSTTMKFALEHTQRSRDVTTISFFFNARGDDLERSTVGMYRSLLLQLLERVPKLQEVLDSVDSVSTNSDDKSLWSIDLLKDTLRFALENFDQQRLVCFVDALDECAEDEIRDMVEFFEELGQLTIKNQMRLQVCFSSRHYPHISVEKGIELVLDEQEGHNQDIAKYLSTKLKTGRSKQMEQVRAEILRKASGIFLWVVLVVQVLQKEYDRGRIHALKEKLAHIPTELNELFSQILGRDDQNVTELLLCVQWILFTKETLSREELYFGILSGTDVRFLGPWDPEETTLEDMERFIVSSSKGLAEITRTQAKRPQFIHESVREFFLKGDGFTQLWPEIEANFQGYSHEKLRACCQKYLKFFSLQPSAQSYSESSLVSDYTRDSICQQYPFLRYAVYNELLHADAAEENGVSQDTFIQSLNLTLWIPLANMFQKRKFRRYTSEANLLYILADRNLPNLIKVCLRHCSTMDVEGERYRFPAFAAIFNRFHEATKAFLMPETLHCDRNIPKGFYSQPDSDVDSLIEHVRHVKPQTGQNLLSYSLFCGYLSTAQRLLATNRVNVRLKDRASRSPLSYAAENGYDTIVELLVAIGQCNDDSRDGHGRTPLSYASEGGHIAIGQLLVATDQCSCDLKDNYHRTPLSYAAGGGHIAIVELLVATRQCNYDSRDLRGRTSLSYAAEGGHIAVVELLAATGQCNNDSMCFDSRTPLSYAAGNGHLAVVKYLLDVKQVHPNSSNNRGLTPLFFAAREGHAAVVDCLLSYDCVNPNPKNNTTRLTALHYAAERGHDRVVDLLLSSDQVYPNSQASDGKTPLILAAKAGHGCTVRLLLATKRVDPCLGDKRSKTPLCWAAEKGHDNVVKQLLSIERLNPNCSDNDGETPLSCAARQGHEGVIRQLLSTGIDPDCGDNTKRTPLFYAAWNNHKGVAELLLATGQVDSDSIDTYGDTPLSDATVCMNRVIVELLLASSPVSPERRRYACSKALSNARALNHDDERKEILDLLTEYRKKFPFYDDEPEPRPDPEA